MNYIYDIILNFNPKIYEIYEWNKNDDLTHIRKIPFYKVKTNDLYNIINNKIKLDNEFLNNIYKKTETFNKNKINTIEYAFLLSDGKEVIAFKYYNNHLNYSKLLYEEEIEVLEYSDCVKTNQIKYEVIEKIKNNFKTRNENNIKKYIYKEINEMIKNNDLDKLNYLYLEIFNKKSNNIKQIYKDIENNWDDVYLKIYNFMKKILLKH